MMQMLAYCNRQMGWKREGELDTVPGPGWQSLRLGSVQGLTNKQIVETNPLFSPPPFVAGLAKVAACFEGDSVPRRAPGGMPLRADF